MKKNSYPNFIKWLIFGHVYADVESIWYETKKKSNLTFFISKKKIVKKKTVKLFFWDILTHIIKTNINNEHRNVTKYFIENIFKKIFISSTTFYNEYFF